MPPWRVWPLGPHLCCSAPQDGWPHGLRWHRLSPGPLRWPGLHWPAWGQSFGPHPQPPLGQAMCPGPGRCSPLPARLTFTGRIHNTCTQPHPVALPHGSVGFASDPRIPPGPSVTIRASHVKAPSHIHLTLLPQSTPVPPKVPLP